jgi:hypothetical protein
MQKIETYLNKAGFVSIANIVAKSAIESFNSKYGTNYTVGTMPANLVDYINLFVAVTLFGWEGVDTSIYSQNIIDLVEIPKDYTGIDTETERLLQNKDKKDYDSVIESRTNTISEILATTIFQASVYLLSDDFDLLYMGSISMEDPKVRPYHALCNRKFWKKGSIKNPCLEPNCRCKPYFFKNIQEAINKGFSQF